MRSLATPLLVLSLAVNIVFGFKWHQGSQRAVEPVEESPAPRNTLADSNDSTATRESKSAPSPNVPSMTFDWQQVESNDYRDYIANLRTIGCPEETIRDIIKADVDKLYKSKAKELQPETEPFEYWKTGNAWVAAMQPNPESMQAQNDLNKENYAHWLNQLDRGFTDEAILDQEMARRYGLQPAPTTTEASPASGE